MLLVVLDVVLVYYNVFEVVDLVYDCLLLVFICVLVEWVFIVNGYVMVDVFYVVLDSFEIDILGCIYYKVMGLKGELVFGYEDLLLVFVNVKCLEVYLVLVCFYQVDYYNQFICIVVLLQLVYDDSMCGIVLIQVGEIMEGCNGMMCKILFDMLWCQGMLVIVVVLLVWFVVCFVLCLVMQFKGEVELCVLIDLFGFDLVLVYKEMCLLVQVMNGYMGWLQVFISVQWCFIVDVLYQLCMLLMVLKI